MVPCHFVKSQIDYNQNKGGTIPEMPQLVLFSGMEGLKPFWSMFQQPKSMTRVAALLSVRYML